MVGIRYVGIYWWSRNNSQGELVVYIIIPMGWVNFEEWYLFSISSAMSQVDGYKGIFYNISLTEMNFMIIVLIIKY